MSEYCLMIDKRKKYLIGEGEVTKEILEELDRNGRKIVEKLEEILEKDGYLEYRDNIVVIKELYGDILSLAKVYKTEGTIYYNDERILELIKNSLILFEKEYYNIECREHTNWWQWEIGIPLILNNIFSLLYKELPREIILKNLKTSRYFQPDARYSGNNPVAIHPSGNPLRLSSGGNRTDTVKISFFRGVILGDEEEIKKSLEALEDVWKYKDDDIDGENDGFYRDGSFIQHGSIPYAGGYGEVLLTGLGEIFYNIKDTKFSKYIKGLENLYEIIFNSFEPFFYNGRFTDMLSGRGITRENNSDKVIGHRILNDILLISGAFVGEQREKIENFVKREVEKYGGERYLAEEKNPFMYQLLKELLEEEKKVEYRNSIKVTNRMNRVMKREEEFAVGIAMHSYNVGNYETMNGENLRGWYTGDGAYYLYDKDIDGYDEYWKNVDMYFIPGTTEIKGNMEGVDAQRNSETKFIEIRKVGGVSLDSTGIAIMDFLNWNEKLKSRKIWFFLQGKTVFIEDKIESDREIYTTLFNKKYLKLPKIFLDGNINEEELIEKSVKEIVIEEWKLKFFREERVKVEIEERGKYYFVKIWKEYERKEKGIIWELINLKSKVIDEILKLKIEEELYQLETDKYMYKILWNKNDICTIENKAEHRSGKMTIEN